MARLPLRFREAVSRLHPREALSRLRAGVSSGSRNPWEGLSDSLNFFPEGTVFLSCRAVLTAGGAGNNLLKVKFMSTSTITLASHH